MSILDSADEPQAPPAPSNDQITQRLAKLTGVVYAGALLAEGVTVAQLKAEFPFYCPACGRAYRYRTECAGTAEKPHRPTEVVPVDELDGDPANHTPAPVGGV